MKEIIPFLQGDAFGPGALRAMSTALEEVCRILKIDNDQGAREVMAIRIVELARGGGCDPERLRDRVLWETGAISSVIDDAPTDAGGTQIRSTTMNNQAKDDQPKEAGLYRLGAASIAILIMYVAIPWWL
jgi:hypothetical protein